MIKTLTTLISFVLLSIHITCSTSTRLPSANRSGKVVVKSNPNPYGHLEYYRALKKYNIQPNDPDTLYHEIEIMSRRRSSRSHLRRCNSTIGEESATLVQMIVYDSAITKARTRKHSTFYLTLEAEIFGFIQAYFWSPSN
jgi:hypothetical protein